MLSSLRRKPRLEGRGQSLLDARDIFPAYDAGRVPTLREVLPRLSIELDRARRYARPLAVVVFSLDPVASDLMPGQQESGGAWPSHSGLFPLLSALLGPSLREALRQTDIVSYTTREAQSLVVLPETTGEGAQRAIERLLQVPAVHVLSPLRVGLGSFPDDGWTLEDVVLCAEKTWVHGSTLDDCGARGGE